MEKVGKTTEKKGNLAKKRMAARRAELHALFANVDEGERLLVSKLIQEVVEMEERMEMLKKQPFLAIHPKRPELMKSTPAAKVYKETSAQYMNAIRILLSVLRQSGVDEAEELIRKLEEFA